MVCQHPGHVAPPNNALGPLGCFKRCHCIGVLANCFKSKQECPLLDETAHFRRTSPRFCVYTFQVALTLKDCFSIPRLKYACLGNVEPTQTSATA